MTNLGGCRVDGIYLASMGGVRGPRAVQACLFMRREEWGLKSHMVLISRLRH